MNQFFTIVFFFLLTAQLCFSQEVTVLISPKQFNLHQQIQLANLDGWQFKQGNNNNWAKKNIDLTDWQVLKPTQLTNEIEDPTGRVEGWFRMKFKLGTDFEHISLGLNRNLWAATAIYLDGNLIQSFGETGKDNISFQAYNPIQKMPTPLSLKVNQEYLLAIHFVNYEDLFTPRGLKLNGDNFSDLVNLTGPKFTEIVQNKIK